jgi:hypothetical protein
MLKAKPSVQSKVSAKPSVQSKVSAKPSVQSKVSAKPSVQSKVSAKPSVQSKVSAKPSVQSKVSAKPSVQSNAEQPTLNLNQKLNSDSNPWSNVSSYPNPEPATNPNLDNISTLITFDSTLCALPLGANQNTQANLPCPVMNFVVT